jgi:Cu/Ag efflux protein CusF
MKRILIAWLLAFAGFAFSLAHVAYGGHDHSGHGAMPTPVENSMTDGVVRRIDKVAGRVTVAHGPLVNLNMPPMVMAFRVKNLAWLEEMRVDGRIRFVADSIGGVLTIVKFETVK